MNFAMTIEVDAKSPDPLSALPSQGWFDSTFHPFYLEQAWKSRFQKTTKSSFTPAQCKALGLVAEREQKLGTGLAAAKSSNTWGDRSIGAFNVDFNNRGNPTVTGGGQLDMDWFTDIMTLGDNARPAAPLT
ncbi:MAG TPA: hypothetical protein VLC46_27765 [Thermoanaerobaculia bacterium]|jgi:hypothetical protein|nr:hypothetical protein [Thermoanaerobaculia bacterium]